MDKIPHLIICYPTLKEKIIEAHGERGMHAVLPALISRSLVSAGRLADLSEAAQIQDQSIRIL